MKWHQLMQVVGKSYKYNIEIMATKKNLGRVAFVYRSDFDPNTFYSRYDVVKYHGSLYHCTYNKSAYRKYNAPINEDGVLNSDWELFLPGCDFVGQNIISSDETIIVKETDKGYDLSTKHTVVKAADGSKNVTIKFDKVTNTYTVSVVDNKITTAQWKNWWIKYPWTGGPVINRDKCIGPEHISSAGMKIIGASYNGVLLVPQGTPYENDYMVTIDESGKNHAVNDGITPPVVVWDIQYAITNKETDTPINGLQFDPDGTTYGPIQMYDAPYDKSKSIYSDGMKGCFGIVGESKVVQWDMGGSVQKNPAIDFNLIERNLDGCIIIFSIINNETFSCSNWHFHYTNPSGNDMRMIKFYNDPNYFHADTPGEGYGTRLYNDVACTNEVEKLPYGKNIYYAFCGKVKHEDRGNFDYVNTYVRPLTEKEKTLLQASKKSSEAEYDANNIYFSINVDSQKVEASIPFSECEANGITFNQSESTYNAQMSTSDLKSNLIYTFKSPHYMDLDEGKTTKHIFKSGDKISIPYYSGCTFIKNE